MNGNICILLSAIWIFYFSLCKERGLLLFGAQVILPNTILDRVGKENIREEVGKPLNTQIKKAFVCFKRKDLHSTSKV